MISLKSGRYWYESLDSPTYRLTVVPFYLYSKKNSNSLEAFKADSEYHTINARERRARSGHTHVKVVFCCLQNDAVLGLFFALLSQLRLSRFLFQAHSILFVQALVLSGHGNKVINQESESSWGCNRRRLPTSNIEKAKCHVSATNYHRPHCVGNSSNPTPCLGEKAKRCSPATYNTYQWSLSRTSHLGQ